ncbi:MAG: NepR family anti-sigma factor [Pseudomonadota bacterium]
MSDQKRERSEAVQQEVQEHIGRKLREMYNYVAEQPIPDRFVNLLDQLESSEDPVKGT